MPSVLLTGTYSSTNRGDAAMQACMAEQLRRAVPGVEVRIHAPFPEEDRAYYSHVPIVPSSRRRLVRASVTLAWLWICRVVFRASPADAARLGGADARAVAEADLVVDLSGDMLTEAHGPHLTWSHFLPLLTAICLDRPLFICAQSVGPFRLTRPMARYVFRRAAAITAREPLTVHELSRLDPTLRVERTADVAFLLEPAPPARVDEILRAEQVDAGAPLFGVSVSSIAANAHARARARGADDFVAEMAAALDTFQERTGARILFVPHVLGPRPSKDDRRISARVRGRMRRGAHAHVLQGAYRSEELKGVIARCEAFVGARMHANIAALSSGVPVLALAYSHKAHGIMQGFGLGEWVVPAASLKREVLTERLDALWHDRAALARQVCGELGAVSDAARRNVAIAVALLRTAGTASAIDAPREPGLAAHG